MNRPHAGGSPSAHRYGRSEEEAEHDTSPSLEVVGTGRALFYDTYDEGVPHVESACILARRCVDDGRLGRSHGVRDYLGKNLTDAGSTDRDAGLRWLQANASVTRAINSAGLPVQGYFVESIAIADADRFIGNPNAAPPTPALSRNAEFLRSHQADVERLKALREGRPVVTITP